MKTKKIILLIITLALVCVAGFSGLVGAFAQTEDTKVLSQPFDTLFPPQSSDFYYLYFDFTNCGIPSNILNSSTVFVSCHIYDNELGAYYDTVNKYSLSQLSNVSLVYQVSMAKAVVIALDMTDITIGILFPDLTSYGIPSIDNVVYFDSEDVSFGSPIFGSSYLYLSIFPTDLRSIVVTFANTELSLVNQYNSLQGQYNTLNTQYSTLQGQYNTLNTQYSTLQGQYNTLNTQYSTLQGQYNTLQSDYEDLYNDWEEERDSKEHYQSLLREANTTIDELENRIEQLELFLDEQPVSAGFGWITYAFQKVGEILSIELLPGISIGLLALIPLVLGVVFFVLRLIRGE